MGLAGCQPNYEKIFRENNEQFELHRPILIKVIANIEQKYLKKWDRNKELILPIDSLTEEIENTLKDLGIGSIEFSYNPNDNCHKNYWITLNVIDNWNIGPLRVVQLVYAPCDKNASKNFHYYDGSHRDFWGQGDHWFIYSDTDFI